MATPKAPCPDCEQPKAECTCTDRCDFCTNLEEECTCGLDHDPYGHKIYDNQQWLREMQNLKGDHEYKNSETET